VLLSTERRPNDGFDAFVHAAARCFQIDVVKVVGAGGGDVIGDIVLQELRLLRS
jgi:hypothetical protein